MLALLLLPLAAIAHEPVATVTLAEGGAALISGSLGYLPYVKSEEPVVGPDYLQVSADAGQVFIVSGEDIALEPSGPAFTPKPRPEYAYADVEDGLKSDLAVRWLKAHNTDGEQQ